ncbi:MAG TPA: NUDIX hydrolase N-terminal domain-containing protein [Caldilineaceae bacterium]|nr:NUDIX hydrolase N-terminal domain-containing protein [Caldilineaceae bacterium]
MNETSSPNEQSARLVEIADQLRALSNNGLIWSNDPYQEERYRQILKLAAELLTLAEMRPLAEIERIFFTDLEMRTPFATVDTAVFDDAGRLLMIQRADNGLWALPGGACDVGETPAAAGAREVREETGYRIAITALLGVWDSRLCGSRGSRHLYHLLFAGGVMGGAPTLSIETLDIRWVEPDAIPWDSLEPGHAPRIRHALAWRANPQTPAYFDPLPPAPASRPPI